MTGKKPLIAVFGSRADKRKMQGINITYMTSISLAGGIPVLAPMYASSNDYARIAESFDGFLFAGGVDIHPKHYGEELLPECGEIDLDRDLSELNAMAEIRKTGKPILGICRGIQSIAVAHGGKLYQDLPSQHPSDILHKQTEDTSVKTHTVRVKEGTKLFEVFGECEFKVNSFHHQAVKETSLTVSIEAPDGTIEGIEDPTHPFLVAVQWHPEYLTASDDRSRRLFEAFVKACM